MYLGICVGCSAHMKFRVVYNNIVDEEGNIMGRSFKGVELVSAYYKHCHRVSAELHAMYANNNKINDEILLLDTSDHGGNTTEC